MMNSHSEIPFGTFATMTTTAAMAMEIADAAT